MVVVDRVGNCKRDGRRRERGESVIEYRAKTSPEIPVGATSSFEPSTICILCIWIAFITHTSLGANCRPEKSWTRGCMLQTATHLAASLLMPCLESIRTRASTYTSHSCSCDTVHASVLSTTNAIGNDEFVEQRKRHFPRECTLLPSSSSRAFLAFFRLSSYRATIFFHPSVCLLFAPAFSRLSTLTKCLTVKRPAKSLANLPFLFSYDVFRLS